MVTGFPNAGDDKKISLRNSKFAQADFAYVLDLKEKHPSIWKLGGNEFGNQAFLLWQRAREGDESQAVLNWIVRRERFMERHLKDFRPAGVMAVFKWGGIVEKGQPYMKGLINEQKKKADKPMSKKILQALKKLIPQKTDSLDQKRRTQADRAKLYGIKAMTSASLTPPPGFPTKEDDYGDPVNLAYPLKPANRLRNAAARLSQFGLTAYAEDPTGLQVVASRIVEAELAAGIVPSKDSKLLNMVPKALRDKVAELQAAEKQQVKKISGAALAKSFALESDEMVLTAFMIDGVDMFKAHQPSCFFVHDWHQYLDGFEKRYGASFEQVAEILKQNNVDGLHNHEKDAKGTHYHGPDEAQGGEHEHTAENPFGLHAHNEGDPVSGAHVHPFGGLGQHGHNANLDTNLPAVYELTAKSFSMPVYESSGLERKLEILQLSKGVENVMEVLTFTLEIHLVSFLNDHRYLFDRIRSRTPNKEYAQLIGALFGSMGMLRDDLRFLHFANGELVEHGGMEDMSKALGVEFQKYERHCAAEGYDIKRVNRALQLLNNIYRIIAAYLELMPDTEGFAEFRNQVGFVAGVLNVFMGKYPELIAHANDIDAIRVKNKVIEESFPELEVTPDTAVNTDDIHELAAEMTEMQREKYAATAINKSAQVTESEFAELMKAMGSPTEKAAGTILCHPRIFLKPEVNNHEIRGLSGVDLAKGAEIEGRILGVVLEPGTSDSRDLQQQFIKADAIRRACYYYMANHQVQGLQHETFAKKQGTQNPQFRLLQNAIAENDITINGRTIKKGSWYQEWLIVDAKIKKLAAEGKLKGFSIGGSGILIPDKQLSGVKAA